jgi:hypothetical protein
VSSQEVQVNGGWIDLDVAVENGLDPMNHDYPFRYKEVAVSDVTVGTMVVYHGVDKTLHGRWAVVYGVFHPESKTPIYSLAFMEADQERADVWFCDWQSQVARNEFTPAEKPEIPEQMTDGIYVNTNNDRVYARVNGKWHVYDSNCDNPWRLLRTWTDNYAQNIMKYLAPWQEAS